MTKKLPNFLDFKNYPAELNASLAVRNELDTLFWVVLPVLLVRHAMSTAFRLEPELATQYFPEVLDETGNFCPTKHDNLIQEFVIERLGPAIQEARQKNSNFALDLIDYAAQEDPPTEPILTLIPELNKIVASFRYRAAEPDDARQDAVLCILEELDALRKSREKLFQAFFDARLNYIYPRVKNKLIDQIRRDRAQKRTPTRLESLDDQVQELCQANSLGYNNQPVSIEEATIAKDLEIKLLQRIAKAFPNQPRLQQIAKLRWENERLSCSDLADLLRCSKKTIDRDLAKLRDTKTIVEFVEKLSSRRR
jgi:RNA polymerase sigma factor (sigma-70 family)